MNSSNFDRDAANREVKAVAAEASKHSSGDVLNMADPSSKYAHGKLERTGSVDENTSMPTTDTTIDGAYSIGNTRSNAVQENYDNKFTEPESYSVGQGSRTVQALPEQVTDLGSTVQTNRTTHVLQTERDPVQYIPPQAGLTSASQVTGQSTTTSTGYRAEPVQATYGQQSTSQTVPSHVTTGTGIRTDSLTTGSHGANATTAGTSSGTTGATAGTTSVTGASDAKHNTTESAKPAKQSFFSKVKHAFS